MSPTVWRGVGMESSVGWTQRHIESSRAGTREMPSSSTPLPGLAVTEALAFGIQCSITRNFKSRMPPDKVLLALGLISSKDNAGGILWISAK